ncbi:MAG: epimerase [Candidatus Contendobacter odensis]|uniref:Epimerase n=1 Tax=Candidatus Contendibacter odensensis TaxID=1400860 RepID=A0A2G6PE41_9GAMM|nr:MAG: epimerase [Candidatus Contendobacter odensis]
MVVAIDFYQGRSVLVTGGNGFIGQRLVAALQMKQARVRALLRPGRIVPVEWQDIEIVHGDVTDVASLAEVCTGINTVFHVAGFAHADAADTPEFAERHWAVNAQGSFNVLDAAVAAGVERLVFLSSAKAVGESDSYCVDERWTVLPETPYGRAKRAAEAQVLATGRTTGMHVVNLRPALVYGAGMKANLARLIAAVHRGWLLPLPETGNCRSLVHIDDIVQALLLAAANPVAAGQTYFVTDGQTYSGCKLYSIICQASGRPVPRWAVPASVLRGAAKLIDALRFLIGYRDQKAHLVLNKLLGWACYCSTRISDELGYQPTWDFERFCATELRKDLYK